jgi:SAM-dependent methyltransferase
VSQDSARKGVSLPYFDMLFGALDRGAEGLSSTFGHHVHWGYWGPGDTPDGSFEDFARGAERLTQRLLDAAGVRDGDRVLDAGCGLGGTIASLDQRCSGLALTGLNIDARQVTLAREKVRARAGNSVDFRVGDACEMPFDHASFDAVLAVECIFHFPSRARFFSEARRVLRRGGRLTLCDFVSAPWVVPSLTFAKRFLSWHIEAATGPIDIRCTLDGYRKLAKDHGFSVHLVDDITTGTLPTYPVLRRLAPETGTNQLVAQSWITALETASRIGGVRYLILGFDSL